MDGILGTKNGIGFFLSISEETEVIVNLIEVDVWESEDDTTGSFIDGFESWYWLCL